MKREKEPIACVYNRRHSSSRRERRDRALAARTRRPLIRYMDEATSACHSNQPAGPCCPTHPSTSSSSSLSLTSTLLLLFLFPSLHSSLLSFLFLSLYSFLSLSLLLFAPSLSLPFSSYSCSLSSFSFFYSPHLFLRFVPPIDNRLRRRERPITRRRRERKRMS